MLLILYLQFGILQMTDVHKWGKLNISDRHSLLRQITSDLFLTLATSHAGFVSNSSQSSWGEDFNVVLMIMRIVDSLVSKITRQFRFEIMNLAVGPPFLTLLLVL